MNTLDTVALIALVIVLVLARSLTWHAPGAGPEHRVRTEGRQPE
ncbi:hypothetical protein [Microlunatus aurantiacus]